MIIDRMNQLAMNLQHTHPSKEELCLALQKIGVIQFGSFTLKSGVTSPVYLDVRKSFTYPSVLRKFLDFLWTKIEGKPYDLLCGVPLSALVFASYFSLEKMQPMIVYRGAAKKHGMKKSIEGEYFAGQQCLIVEDVISSGKSVFETKQALESEGLIVSHVVALIDREQGGVEKLRAEGISVETLVSLTEILQVCAKAGTVAPEQVAEVETFMGNLVQCSEKN